MKNITQPSVNTTPGAQKHQLDGQGLIALTEAALTWLKTNQQTVNALNVFPVPDGDTGTNMVLTMQAAFHEVSNSTEKNVGKIAHDIAQGALMGARGNSGVILSQLWRGFARILDSYETADLSLLARAFVEARDTAYKGVVRPVEGTILTVATEIAFAAEQALSEFTSGTELLEHIVKVADQAVMHTPELLPILKQAGVVDSGGKGLFYILEGMLRYRKGESLGTPTTTLQPLSLMQLDQAMDTVEPGQDYEVVIDFRPHQKLDIESYYDALSEIGTSIQLGEGDGMYRMHIHVPTENRYKPIDHTMSIGTITKVYIENLLDQTNQTQTPEALSDIKLAEVSPGQIAVVVVSPGIGISKIFGSLGVAAIIEGGQTMNPSTEEILAAFENLPTENIIILPNNKNIILASQAATNMSVKNVAVIPSTSVPQGLSAALRFLPDDEFDHVVESMKEAIKEVETGEITTATRSVDINGVHVQEGEVIVLLNGKLIKSTNTIEDASLSLLEQANTDEMERITLFYGNNIKLEQVNSVVEKIQEKYPDHEIEVHEGGQPHYQFIIAIE